MLKSILLYCHVIIIINYYKNQANPVILNYNQL